MFKKKRQSLEKRVRQLEQEVSRLQRQPEHEEFLSALYPEVQAIDFVPDQILKKEGS